MTDYGVDASGFKRKPLSVVLSEIAEQQRGNIDPTFDTSAESLAGKYNGIFGAALDELWAQAEAVYASGDRSKAFGAALAAIGELTGTPQLAATKSKVTASLSLSNGTFVPAGSVASVAGNPAARFVTIEDFTAPAEGAGPFPVAMESETAGPVLALAGTLSVIETSVTGWGGITNAEDAVPGAPVESTAAYRLRQVLELASPGGGTVAGIKADLEKVAGVTAAEVLENTTARTSADGIPSHSFESIVLGGDDADVAASIAGNKPSSIATHGSTTVDGVSFTRPTERNVYVSIRYTGAPSLDAAIKAAIVASTTTPSLPDGTLDPGFLSIASDVYASRLLCAAVDVEGVVDAQLGISFSSIATPEDGAQSLAIGTREIARLDTSRITVIAA